MGSTKSLWPEMHNFVQVQVNLCQKLWFLQQLTHNMTTNCSLNYKLNTWKLQAHNIGSTCCVQKLFLTFRTISPHVLQKYELLTKIYLYLSLTSIVKCFLGLFLTLLEKTCTRWPLVIKSYQTQKEARLITDVKLRYLNNLL